MKDRKWHKGPPPHIGWWNASDARLNKMWRWWNGEFGCRGVTKTASGLQARQAAAHKEYPCFPIEWTTYYPKRARVPRRAP